MEQKETEHSRVNTLHMFTMAKATVESDNKDKHRKATDSHTSVDLNPSFENQSIVGQN